MVQSIIVVCEDSPFGKNSAMESIRLATGLLAVGDIELCKVIFLKDAIYFLNKNINPEANISVSRVSPLDLPLMYPAD